MAKDDKEFDDLMLDYLTGNLSKDDIPHFLSILKSNKIYQKRYRKEAELYAKIHTPFFEANKEKSYSALKRKMNISKPASFPWTINLRRIAAVIAICTLSGIAGFYLQKNISSSNSLSRIAQNELIVPFGSQSKIILPDSSVVWLNSGSVLKYDRDFGGKTRKVHLLGEGYFEVYKDAKKPFHVFVGDLDVKVLGTTFNIRAYPTDNSIDVSLITGKVNVSLFEHTEQLNATLLPNKRLSFDKHLHKATVSNVDAEKSAEWTTGKLSFVNTSLADILKDIERRLDVRINIESDAVYKEYFTGSVSLKLTIPEILDYIDVDSKYVWNKKGNVITIQNK